MYKTNLCINYTKKCKNENRGILMPLFYKIIIYFNFLLETQILTLIYSSILIVSNVGLSPWKTWTSIGLLAGNPATIDSNDSTSSIIV